MPERRSEGPDGAGGGGDGVVPPRTKTKKRQPPPRSAASTRRPSAKKVASKKYSFTGEGEDYSGNEAEGEEICDAQAVSINSGCQGGFPIGVGCAVSGEGGLAFAVQSEATSPGTGELILTGKIGKSMAESCMVALSWVKAKSKDIAAWMGLEGGVCLVDLHRPDLDVHVNFPSCEAEKNGPSAGATVATSLVLLMSGAKLRPNVAISGEVNLRGYLLPIGNVKEKVAAAARQGITHIVLSSANIKQFRRLPAKCRNAVKALKADHMLEVIKHAVEPPHGAFCPEFEAAVKHHAGMGVTASLACSHIKGKVQWVECCATTGRGEWHITGNVQEGTRGSVLVARTWVRKNAAEIVARLGHSASIRVELCSMKGLGNEWRGGGGGGDGGGGGGAATAASSPSHTILPSSSASSASSATTIMTNGSALMKSAPLGVADGPSSSSSPLDVVRRPPPQLDMHVHLPETEVAKDVSINGAAAAVSMIAVMTGLPVRPDVAVLGEITLAGVLWPLEQVNEAEVRTAIDAHIAHLILPMDNVRQIEKVPKEMRRGLRVTGAVRLLDVIEQLFLSPSEQAASAAAAASAMGGGKAMSLDGSVLVRELSGGGNGKGAVAGGGKSGSMVSKSENR